MSELDDKTVETVEKADEVVVEQTLGEQVDGLLKELEEIQDMIGFKNQFDDIEFPELRTVVLPEIEHPVREYEPVTITKETISKMDEEQLEVIMRKLKKLDAMSDDIKDMQRVIDERLNVDFKAMYDNILEQMNVEAIKIYRNVQAVVVEENAKQNAALFGIDGKSDNLKKRMNKVMIFSIVSFVVSILVMIVTILPSFGIKLM